MNKFENINCLFPISRNLENLFILKEQQRTLGSTILMMLDFLKKKMQLLLFRFTVRIKGNKAENKIKNSIIDILMSRFNLLWKVLAEEQLAYHWQTVTQLMTYANDIDFKLLLYLHIWLFPQSLYTMTLQFFLEDFQSFMTITWQ